MDRTPTRMPTQDLGDGKYKILRRLAVGGMAEIYLAEAANIHGFRKKVVIKRILPQYAGQPSYVEMFLDEARLAARLNHASIVQVFDIGEDAEGVFFTMEYVDGRDLAEILGACYKLGRRLKLEEVLAVLMPTAEALHHAHELRDDHNQLCHLIHRDVSPSNILVTNEGRVKLLDFGVAKSNDQQRETTGVSLKGKFGYMSPEQCQGQTLDRRCDIFSFGVVLWELCTGQRLFPGGNDPSVLVKIMNQDAPPPSSVRPDLHPELDRICLKALARDRDARYRNLREVIHDLDDFAKSAGVVTSSRTLSRLIEDVFSENRPTSAMKAVLPLQPSPESSKPSLGKRGSYASRDLANHAAAALASNEGSANPIVPSTPGMVPVAAVDARSGAVVQSSQGMPAYQGFHPSSGSNGAYAAGSYGGSAVAKRRMPLIIGAVVALVGGVALAIAAGGGTDNDETELPVPAAVESAEPEEAQSEGTPKGTETLEPEADPAPEPEADPAPEQGTDPAPEPGADLASEPGTDPAPGQEPASASDEAKNSTTPDEKNTRKKTRGKPSKSTKKVNKPEEKKIKKPEEKWNPNSPFAPE